MSGRTMTSIFRSHSCRNRNEGEDSHDDPMKDAEMGFLDENDKLISCRLRVARLTVMKCASESVDYADSMVLLSNGDDDDDDDDGGGAMMKMITRIDGVNCRRRVMKFYDE